MRILVTGASGLLGGRLAALLRRSASVVAGRHLGAPPDGLPSVGIDLLSPESVRLAILESRPDAILHSAALADPDRCESEPERARALNVEASRALARLARQQRVRLVLLSTDLVFPGEGGPFGESAPPRPLMVYGRTKLEGEEAALGEDPSAAVARVALVCGRGHGRRSTASESVAWALLAGRRLRLYTDQFRTPVDGGSLASALVRLLGGREEGVFHMGGAERLSRYELGLRTARLMGLDASLIDPVSSTEGSHAPRPRDVSLDSSRAARELGFRPRPLDEALLESRRSPEEASEGPGEEGRV